ncbi:MAG: J domain-containing protein, partial [Hyphomicrobiales bacterium]|nr:J domain-containing protein [Hyphomicrobiales bacterium]
KALDTLGLEPGVDKAALKARFKELVKRLHPDANSGDRSHEDQLREIINAYNYLRTAGLA